MMTPILEQLVLSGQAEVKTHNHGVSGVGTLFVPPGKSIIILQIIYHPFIDVIDSVLKGSTIWKDDSGSFLHTMKLRSGSSRTDFTFRDTFKPILDANANQMYFAPERPNIINTYLKFTGDVQIDFMKFRKTSEWLAIHDYLPDATNEAPYNEGYGTVSQTVNQEAVIGVDYLFPLAAQPMRRYYNPVGIARGVASDPAKTNEEFIGFQSLTHPPQRNLPGEGKISGYDIFNFPVTTFTYVEINARFIPGNVLQTINPNKR